MSKRGAPDAVDEEDSARSRRVRTAEVLKGQVGVEASAYVHVEKHAGLNCGRLGPVDGGLDVGHDSGIGHKLGEVASHGSDGARVGCHPSRRTPQQALNLLSILL